MSENNNTSTRRTYELDLEDAAILHALVGPDDQPTNDAQAEAVNQFWFSCGTDRGFRWTTVDDLQFIHSGSIGNVTSATFTAEADEPVPAEAIDHDAEAWLDREVPEWRDARCRPELALRAFAAGRDHGFTMGSATPQSSPEARRRIEADRAIVGPLMWMHDCGRVLDQLLPENLNWGRNLSEIATDLIAVRYPELCPAIGRDPSPGWDVESKALMVAATAMLAECAQLFREYEAHHRAQVTTETGGEGFGQRVDARRAKAERNRDIAERIEALLWVGNTGEADGTKDMTAGNERWEQKANGDLYGFGETASHDGPTLTLVVNGTEYRTTATSVRGKLGGCPIRAEWNGATDLRVHIDTPWLYADAIPGAGRLPAPPTFLEVRDGVLHLSKLRIDSLKVGAIEVAEAEDFDDQEEGILPPEGHFFVVHDNGPIPRSHTGEWHKGAADDQGAVEMTEAAFGQGGPVATHTDERHQTTGLDRDVADALRQAHDGDADG